MGVSGYIWRETVTLQMHKYGAEASERSRGKDGDSLKAEPRTAFSAVSTCSLFKGFLGTCGRGPRSIEEMNEGGRMRGTVGSAWGKMWGLPLPLQRIMPLNRLQCPGSVSTLCRLPYCLLPADHQSGTGGGERAYLQILRARTPIFVYCRHIDHYDAA